MKLQNVTIQNSQSYIVTLLFYQLFILTFIICYIDDGYLIIAIFYCQETVNK